MIAAALALSLGAGSAVAQEAAFQTAPVTHGHLNWLHSTSAYSRDVGPGSSVTGLPFSPLGSSLNGNPQVPGAPSAGPVNGGGGH